MLHLYRVRLRSRLLQECFAVVGIAAGVALLFASQIASHSLSSSVAQLSQGIVGSAKLQVLSRDPRGFDQSLLGKVRHISGVRLAAPLLEANADALGPRGSRSVELIGADESLTQLGGTLVRHTKLAPFGGIGAIVMPGPLARAHRRDQVRRRSDARDRRSRQPGAALQTAFGPRNRAFARHADRRRPAVLRPGNGWPSGPRHAHPRHAEPGSRAGGAGRADPPRRGAARTSPRRATTSSCSPRPPPPPTSRPCCSP